MAPIIFMSVNVGRPYYHVLYCSTVFSFKFFKLSKFCIVWPGFVSSVMLMSLVLFSQPCSMSSGNVLFGCIVYLVNLLIWSQQRHQLTSMQVFDAVHIIFILLFFLFSCYLKIQDLVHENGMCCVVFNSDLFISAPLSLTLLTLVSKRCHTHCCLGRSTQFMFSKF